MELKSVLEALLFASQKPLSPAELRDLLVGAAADTEEEAPRAFKKVKVDELTPALEALAQEIEGAQRTFRLVCVAGAWQFVSRPEFGPWLRVLLGVKARPPRLSAPALETLAIIAYRQPITRAEMEQIRGVSVDGVVQTLQERGLIEVTGRAEVVGRPANYGTTALFLEYFGLRSLEGLPAAEDLRRLTVEKPPSLLTVDPGLATAPPTDLAQPSLPLDGTPPPPPPPAEPAALDAEGAPGDPATLTPQP